MERVARQVGIDQSLKAFHFHAHHQPLMEGLGFTPLVLAKVADRIRLPGGFSRSLHQLTKTKYEQPVSQGEYKELLDRETYTARLEAVREIFPANAFGYINDEIINHVISFAKDDAPDVISHYDSHIHTMEKTCTSLLAFAYLVSRMEGPLGKRLRFAPELTGYSVRNKITLENAILDYNNACRVTTRSKKAFQIQSQFETVPLSAVKEAHFAVYTSDPEQVLIQRLSI